MTRAVPGVEGAAPVLAALLEARTGQRIAPTRAWRLDVALRPLLAERALESVDQLVAQLLGGRDAGVGDRIVDALLNQESSFFRDPGVIESVADALAGVTGRRPRAWSAGCAGGQEPYSLAMLLAERGAEPMPEIVATDVSESTLARARAGRFSHFEIQRGLPVRRMMRWFEGDDQSWTARPELARAVAFRRHNLVAEPPPPGGFDAILCRNVLLYLTPERRRQVLEAMAGALRPGGVLVLGAGETVIGQTAALVPSTRHRGAYEAAPAARRCA